MNKWLKKEYEWMKETKVSVLEANIMVLVFFGLGILWALLEISIHLEGLCRTALH